METIAREQLQRRLENGDVTLVEVLGEEMYKKFHLPGAINVPLGDDFADRFARAVPNKEAPIVVYCMDAACDASPTAAKRLDELGYQHVYDYQAGKMDWKDAGLPVES